MAISEKYKKLVSAKAKADAAERKRRAAEEGLKSELLSLATSLLGELHRQSWMPVRIGSFRLKLGEHRGSYVELTMADLRHPSGEAVPADHFRGWPEFVSKAQDFLATRLGLPDGLRLSMGIDLYYVFSDGDQ